MTKYVVVFCLIIVGAYPYLSAQTNSAEFGLPPLHNFTPDDYRAGHENFDATQDARGVMYFANADGLLVYDGSSWQLSPIASGGGAVRALQLGEKQTVFIGGYNELGYFEPDSIGQMIYKSLMPLVGESDFGFIWEIVIWQDAVVFQARNKLFVYREDNITTIEIEAICTFFEEHNHDLLVGLVSGKVGSVDIRTNKIDWWDIKLGSQPPKIADLEITQDDTLMLSIGSGLHHFENGEWIEGHINTNQILEATSNYRLEKVESDQYAIAGRMGLLIVDQSGVLIEQLNDQTGLHSNLINNVYLDSAGNLWLTTSSGIAMVEFSSPYSYFDQRNGVEGYVEKVIRYQGDLLVACQQGVVSLGDKSNYLIGPGRSAHDFLLVQDELFIATRQGTYHLLDSQLSQLDSRESGALLGSTRYPGIIFVGLRHGLGYLQEVSGEWQLFMLLEEQDRDIRVIVEDQVGHLWLEPQEGGIFRLQLDQDDLGRLTLSEKQYFRSGSELPPGWAFLDDFDGKAIIQVEDDIFLYSPDLDSLVADSTFGSQFGFDQPVVARDVRDPDNMWFKASLAGRKHKDLFHVRATASGYSIDTIELQGLNRASRGHIAEGNILWHYGMGGMARQNIERSGTSRINMHTLLRKVLLDGKSQALALTDAPEFTFGGDYRFEFSFPVYGQLISQVAHQFFLEGYDQGWGEWQKETKKDYTRLPEGDYTFRVRSRTLPNEVSEEATYSFRVLPPWHRTSWAYLLYVLAGIMGTSIIVRWRSAQLRKEKMALEGTVASRTAELQLSNEKLEQQKVKLKKQAEKLREVDQMKSRLFANISHEFRTPLTLIKGPLNQLARFPSSRLSDAHVGMMNRNTDRLLRLVNQLLDLSKLDAGNLPVNLSEGNVYQVIRLAASAFASMAAERNLDYQMKIPPLTFWSSFDRDHIEKIVYNLLSNAFKFTPNDGSILVKSEYADGHLLLHVKDSGVGISAAHQQHIFERFYQVDDSSTRNEEGSGIGLALVHELVENMRGSIHVDSELGHGTNFMVRIPMHQILAPVSSKEQLIKRVDEKLLQGAGVVENLQLPLNGVDRASVLVVEDNSDMRVYIGDHLASQYEVSLASDGPAGLQQALDSLPDLIVSDVMMPEMDGLQLCELIKSDERTSHIPIIMLTAKAGLENKLAGLETGADVYLTKPFDARELLAHVQNLIAQRIQLREKFSQIDQFAPKDIAWSSYDQKFLSKLMDLLEEHHDDPDFGIPMMLEKLVMSRTQLHRKVKALTNNSPANLLRDFRLKRAVQFLEKGENVTQTAFRVGFNSVSYFGKTFKEMYGMVPSEYASSIQKIDRISFAALRTVV